MKKILLDEFHVTIYVNPRAKVTAKDRRYIKNFFGAMVWMLEFPMNDHMKKKLKIEVTR